MSQSKKVVTISQVNNGFHVTLRNTWVKDEEEFVFEDFEKAIQKVAYFFEIIEDWQTLTIKKG